MVLAAAPPRAAALHWRALGAGRYRAIPLRHVARGVYAVTLPPARADLEYYLEAVLDNGQKVRWPATAPAINQTVLVW